MPDRISPTTKLVFSIAEEMAAFRGPKKDRVVPFMEERLERADAFNRLQKMSPEEREGLLRKDRASVLRMLPRGKR